MQEPPPSTPAAGASPAALPPRVPALKQHTWVVASLLFSGSCNLEGGTKQVRLTDCSVASSLGMEQLGAGGGGVSDAKQGPRSSTQQDESSPVSICSCTGPATSLRVGNLAPTHLFSLTKSQVFGYKITAGAEPQLGRPAEPALLPSLSQQVLGDPALSRSQGMLFAAWRHLAQSARRLLRD